MPTSEQLKQEAKEKFSTVVRIIMKLPKGVYLSGTDEIIDCIIEAAVMEAKEQKMKYQINTEGIIVAVVGFLLAVLAIYAITS